MLTSTHAHALIKLLDTVPALQVPGVLAVVTGNDCSFRTGRWIDDRPPLAQSKVRYYGEPVAVAVAYSEDAAMRATQAIRVEYEPLPVVNSIEQALAANAPLVHEDLSTYPRVKPNIYPEQGTNVVHRSKIRKGDLDKGWAQSAISVEADFVLPESDHAAMETRCARAEITPNGQVVIHTSSQTPFTVKEMIFRHFHVPIQKVVVNTPLVGGAFGGKCAVQLELIAYLATRAVGGRPVLLVNTREQDMTTSPIHMGVKAHLKLGAAQDGTLLALDAVYYVNCGAYSDSTPIMCEAIAANCTGPYRVPNVKCDALCVYTNHTFATSFRGFGHTAYTFAMERMLDKLAYALGIDGVELRLRNAILPGDKTPTMVRTTRSNLGDLPGCINKLRQLVQWDAGRREVLPNGKIRAQGMGCFWKTSSSPPDALSSAVIFFNEDGSINLHCGVCELGQGTTTVLAQILAEKLQMDVRHIHVNTEVNTAHSPWHWKTVASMSTYMAGRAVLEAAADAITQLRTVAAAALRCAPGELEVGKGRVYLRSDPDIAMNFEDIVHGYKYPNGNAIGGQIIGRGTFIMRHLVPMEKNTGKGRTGPGWTVGAQAVEVEFDPADCSYRLVKAATVIDAGKVLNPRAARGIITGGMCMGLGYGCKERFDYSADGIVLNTQFRTYKMLRFGENPEYLVEFLETPWLDAPFGARGFGEHGILAIPAALANALSVAAQVDLDQLPLVPETIWRARKDLNR